MKNDPGFGTRCVHAGEGHNPFGAHATPIYQTSTFVFENAEQAASAFSGGPGYIYIRSPPNTPTHAAFMEKICSLEGGQAGLAFSSGVAAETTLALSLLKAGDHLMSSDVIYGGTYGLFSTLLGRLGIEVSFVDTTDPRLVEAGLRENTRLVFLESPANPTMAICDIGRISELIKTMRRSAVMMGGTMGTHEAWLCLRGLKTLHLRMARHAENAMHLAQFLESHPKVLKVNYPGLASHAQHPASMTHAVMPREMREKLGISDGLVRVSVGIEDGEDIVADLEQGLDAV